MSEPIQSSLPPEPATPPPATNWQWPLGLGALLIVLAATCFYKVLFGGSDNPILIGLFMIVGGVAEGLLAVFGRAWREFVSDLAPALLYVIVGVVIVAEPLTGSFWLTLVLTAAFVTGAVFRIAAWFRDRPLHGWSMLGVAAAVSALVWLVLVWTWPRSGIWVLGSVAGVGLAVTGWWWIRRGLDARAAHEEL
ncbi:HdeD family acid-resistance protein [Alsobacter sp. R-9]